MDNTAENHALFYIFMSIVHTDKVGKEHTHQKHYIKLHQYCILHVTFFIALEGRLVLEAYVQNFSSSTKLRPPEHFLPSENLGLNTISPKIETNGLA